MLGEEPPGRRSLSRRRPVRKSDLVAEPGVALEQHDGRSSVAKRATAERSSSDRRPGRGVLGGQHAHRQVHIAGGGLRGGVAHQLAQHQQVDPGGGQLGAVGVPQPVRAHPCRARARPGGCGTSCASRPRSAARPRSGRAAPRSTPAWQAPAGAPRAGRRPARRRTRRSTGTTRSRPPLPTTRTRRIPMSTSASRSGGPRRPAARPAPSPARSPGPGAVPRSARNTDTSAGSSDSGSRRGWRTSRPRPDPARANVSEQTSRFGRSPWPRRGAGTGLSARAPAITATRTTPAPPPPAGSSTQAPRHAPRRSAPPCRSRLGRDCQSIQSKTSVGTRSPRPMPHSSRKRARHTMSNT